MQRLALDHMSDSEHEANCQEVLRHVRSHGGEIGRSALYRLCRRLDSRQLSGVLDSLVEQGQIGVEIEKAEGRGKDRRRIVLLADHH